MTAPEITAFFDSNTSTITYVVVDPDSRVCAIIDPVLDYEARSGHISTASLDQVCAFVAEQGLTVQWVLDTHIHADHLSGMQEAKARLGGATGIGSMVGEVQETFAGYYNLPADFPCDGSQFDRLFQDGEEFSVGGIPARALHVPGHTPACSAYVIGDSVFTGDSLLMPEFGTARCDFPGGDSTQLYASIRKILELPPDTRMFVGHAYPPEGQAPAWETSVAAQRSGNAHMRDGVSLEKFVELRDKRDAGLPLPALMLAAVQVNIRAGALPAPESNKVSYLKIPLTR